MSKIAKLHQAFRQTPPSAATSGVYVWSKQSQVADQEERIINVLGDVDVSCFYKEKKKIYPEITFQPLCSGSREELQGSFSFEAARSWNIHTDAQDNGHFDYVELCFSGLRPLYGAQTKLAKIWKQKSVRHVSPSLSWSPDKHLYSVQQGLRLEATLGVNGHNPQPVQSEVLSSSST